MNQTLMLDLASKVMEANALDSRYRFKMEFDDYSFRVYAVVTHTQLHTCVLHTIAEYDDFTHNHDPERREMAFNNAIAQMTNFIRYKDFPSVIRLLMAKDMMQTLREKGKEYVSDEIFEYFGIDPQVVGGVINATA